MTSPDNVVYVTLMKTKFKHGEIKYCVTEMSQRIFRTTNLSLKFRSTTYYIQAFNR